MKKNIDHLFKDQFKGAEITPPEEIWKSISSQLPFKKRKKRILPIWYLMAGAAAVLAILILIFKENPSPASNQRITNSPEKSVDTNKRDRPEVSTSQGSEPESLSELNKGVVQTNIQKPEAQNPKENQETTTTDRQSHIRNRDAKITPGTYTLTEVKNMARDSRTEEPLNSEYKLSQLIRKDLEIAANDSIARPEDKIATVEDIEDLPNKIEAEESVRTTMTRRLSITTTAGALAFDNLSGGSGIDEQFANNNVSSEITTSYGINFGYQLSKKIKIRTGISQINLVSNTQNVAYSSLLNSQVIEGSEFSSIPSPDNGVAVFGTLDQNIGFIEVPSEVVYAIADKKFGVHLIGGFSTLFLNKNKISINTDNLNTDLGKVNNLNEISFTANAGLGLSYKISPQFHFNLEPIFKYQLNTFKGTKDFNPYYFGMYSGFSFKF